jgi:hypothetical protein
MTGITYHYAAGHTDNTNNTDIIAPSAEDPRYARMTGRTYLYAAGYTDSTNDPHPHTKAYLLCGKAYQ